MTSTELPSYNEPHTEIGTAEFVSKVVDKCSQWKDLSNLDSLGSLLKSLLGSYFDLKDYRKKMCEVLIRKGFNQISNTIVQNLMKRGYFSDDQIWIASFYIFNILWNFSDSSQEFATSLNDTEIPKALVANVIYQPYLNNLVNKNTYYLMKASVSTIHNVARHPGNQGPYDIKELKTSLVFLIKWKDSDFLSLVSMLALSVLVNETELPMLEEGKNTITLLVHHIKSAQSMPTKIFDGFMIWELVNALRCISANDNMKKMIVEKGGLEVLSSVMQSPSKDEDVEKSMATLWNLCFDQEIRTTLETKFDLRNLIQPYAVSTSFSIKKSYNGICWLLGIKNQSIERVKSAATTKNRSSVGKEVSKYDIFFSYAWANKVTVLSIKNELVKSKMRIWIDVDQMKGSTLEAMADGIENACVFVMAVSEAYRTSPNCRTEAEYAFSLNKPIVPLIMDYKYKPTSWLGLIIGSKTYYEFSERRVFQETLRDLTRNIGDILNMKNMVEEQIVPAVVAGTQRDQTDSSRRLMNVSVVDSWSNADVATWLTKSRLGAFKARFVDIDGPLLCSMIAISSSAPDYLFQTLQTEFGMKLVDVLRFNVAIGNLSLK